MKKTNFLTVIFIFFLLIVMISACTESHEDTYEPVATKNINNIKEDLNKYATKLVASTNNNIFGFTVKEPSPTNSDYLILFQTSDPNLMADKTADKDKNPVAYTQNIVKTAAWDAKFCTQELKSIMTKYEINYVDGVLRDAKTQSNQAISLCANPSNPTVAENLNMIQNMMEKMDSWK